MPIGSINDLIAKLNETKEPEEKDETATWRAVPNRDARRHDGRPLLRTGRGAARRRALRASAPHWARVNHVQRIVRKAEARKAVAAERRLLPAILEAERALQAAELMVGMYDRSESLVFVGSDGSHWNLIPGQVDLSPLNETRKATA